MDPTVLGHAVYRPLLQAMSRPGTIQRLPAAACGRPLLAVLDALLDREVGFHVAERSDGAPLAREIARVTGSRPVRLEDADFLVCPDGESGERLLRARRGTLEYPDGGATAVYQILGTAPSGGRFVLRGPGIRDSACPELVGLGPDELPLLREVNRQHPLGIDAVFLDRSGQVVCIPRSTRIEEA